MVKNGHILCKDRGLQNIEKVAIFYVRSLEKESLFWDRKHRCMKCVRHELI